MSARKFGQEGIGVRGEQKSVGSDALQRDGASAEKDTPPSPRPTPAPHQRGGNWRRLRMRDVHLRGKVLCVLVPAGDVCE